MKIIAVMNYKGGVGKTTVTANLGAALAAKGKRVLLIDVDPQTSLTFCFFDAETWRSALADSHTIKKWCHAIIDGVQCPLSSLCLNLKLIDARVKSPGKLRLISSHLDLINVDLDLASQLGGGSETVFNKGYIKMHSHLRRALPELANDYDFILIDCPPNFNVVTKNAIIASDHILIPAKPDYLSTLGIDYLIKSVNGLVREYNAKVSAMPSTTPVAPTMLGVVFTMIQYAVATTPIMAQQQFIDQVKQMPNMNIFKTHVRLNNTKFGDSGQSGVPYVLSGHTDALGKAIIQELMCLADEFLQAVAKAGGLK